jgi:tyrosinase
MYFNLLTPIKMEGRMDTGRREFMAGAGAAALLAGGTANAQTGRVYTRLSTTDTNQTQRNWDSYARGVQRMLALPPTDGRNWYRQALIHEIDCPHGNWWFVNWHRGYIWRFEQIVREMSGDPDFALPFWDWTNLQEVPAQVYNNILDPTNVAYQNTFQDFWSVYGPGITNYYNSLSTGQKAGIAQRDIANAAQLQQAIQGAWSNRSQARGNRVLSARAKQMCSRGNVTQILRLTDFFTFGSAQSTNHNDEFVGSGSLEGQPHNNVHGSVGTPYGFMGDFMSPVDPVFWLHHANVDRLWWLWQRRNPQTRGLPTTQQGLARWLAEPYTLFFGANGQPAPATAADYVSSEALGVTYGPGFGGVLARRPFLSAAFESRQSNTLAALRAGREVSSDAKAVPRALLAAGAQEDGPAVVAHVSIVPPSDLRRVSVDVYINCPYLGPDTPIDDPHYVSSIDFFGARHGAGHAAHGGDKPREYALPLANTLAALAGAGKPVRGAIRVQLRANAPGGGGRELDARLAGVRVVGNG